MHLKTSLSPAVWLGVHARGMVHDEDARVDFGMAEALAFGTLALHRGVRPPGSEPALQAAAEAPSPAADASLGLNFGSYSVRLSGQDVERGTFNHRHAVLYDEATGARCAACMQSRMLT
jgi:2-oxoglutarate dehydrogenase E1 component